MRWTTPGFNTIASCPSGARYGSITVAEGHGVNLVPIDLGGELDQLHQLAGCEVGLHRPAGKLQQRPELRQQLGS